MKDKYEATKDKQETMKDQQEATKDRQPPPHKDTKDQRRQAKTASHHAQRTQSQLTTVNRQTRTAQQ
jgi:hypothetical protein